MEVLPESQRALVESELRPQRQLPSGANKIERITQHTKSLVEDMTSWVDLRIKLTKLEIKEEIDARLNEALVGAIAASVALLGGIFLLITIALGLGAWLGHPAWGFLIVSIVLLLIAVAFRAAKPDLVTKGERRVQIDEKKLTNNLPET